MFAKCKLRWRRIKKEREKSFIEKKEDNRKGKITGKKSKNCRTRTGKTVHKNSS